MVVCGPDMRIWDSRHHLSERTKSPDQDPKSTPKLNR